MSYFLKFCIKNRKKEELNVKKKDVKKILHKKLAGLITED